MPSGEALPGREETSFYIGLPFVSMRPSVLIYSASGLVYLIWIILVGRRLFMLTQGGSKEEAKQN
jgi:hypothetical protein